MAFIGTYPFNYCFSWRIGRSDIEVAPADSLFGSRYFWIDPPAELSLPGRSFAMSRDRLWLRGCVLVSPGGSPLPPRLVSSFEAC